MKRWPVEKDFVIEEETIYCEDSRERLLEDDEIESWESGFMQGWDSAWDDEAEV